MAPNLLARKPTTSHLPEQVKLHPTSIILYEEQLASFTIGQGSRSSASPGLHFLPASRRPVEGFCGFYRQQLELAVGKIESWKKVILVSNAFMSVGSRI
jgi:hypothetical protein